MTGSDKLNTKAITPTAFKIQRDAGQLVVTWQDGHTSRFDMLRLRKSCPCATCNEDRRARETSSVLLPILTRDPGGGPPQLVDAKLVGNYAIQFVWSDGHDTGIYDFRFLRSLDA